MKFDDSFEIPAPADVAWDALTDIERVYPCLPGADLTEIKDDEFHGLVTLRLGPITATYRGTARFEDLDPDRRTLVIRAEGRDKHGQGTARAKVSAKLVPENGVTRVEMSNEVDITGKAAQFGRGILQDVSKEILGEFAGNLRAMVSGSGSDAEQDETGDGGRAEAAADPGGDRSPAGGEGINVVTLGGRVAIRRARESPLGAGATVALLAAVVIAIVWLIGR